MTVAPTCLVHLSGDEGTNEWVELLITKILLQRLTKSLVNDERIKFSDTLMRIQETQSDYKIIGRDNLKSFCVDYKRLNGVTIRGSYEIQRFMHAPTH